MEKDIEQIRMIVEETGRRYAAKQGSITFAGVEGATVKISPAGFCWR